MKKWKVKVERIDPVPSSAPAILGGWLMVSAECAEDASDVVAMALAAIDYGAGVVHATEQGEED